MLFSEGMGGCCSKSSSRDVVVLNGRPLRKLSLIGEGGFAFVYLVEDTSTGAQYALKQVRCAESEHVESALREAELHTLFDHPNLLKVVDYGVVSPGSSRAMSGPGEVNLVGGGTGSGPQVVLLLLPYLRGGSLHDLLGHMRSSSTSFSETEALALFVSVCTGVRELHLHDPPLAHRDVKPGNILLNDNNCPLLMDFGSMRPARVNVRSRAMAVALADEAAENSTAPYRAPELFDVSSDGVVDERTDVWSLGALLYAIAFGESPFEAAAGQAGGSIALAVLSGRYEVPEDHGYSDRFLGLIEYMLNTDPETRPFIDDVIARARAILRDHLDPNYDPDSHQDLPDPIDTPPVSDPDDDGIDAAMSPLTPPDLNVDFGEFAAEFS